MARGTVSWFTLVVAVLVASCDDGVLNPQPVPPSAGVGDTASSSGTGAAREARRRAARASTRVARVEPHPPVRVAVKVTAAAFRAEKLRRVAQPGLRAKRVAEGEQ